MKITPHPSRVTLTKKSGRGCRRGWGEGNPNSLLVGVKNQYNRYGNQFCSSSKNWNAITIWPSYSTLGHIPGELHTLTHRHLHIHVYCCSVYDSKETPQTQMFTMNEQKMKIWYMYKMEYYSVLKKYKIRKMARLRMHNIKWGHTTPERKKYPSHKQI